MRKITYLLASLSLMFFIECNDSTELIENQSQELTTIQKNDFTKKRSSKEEGEFLKKCLIDPIGMGMIKFDKNNLKEYKIKNKDLERMLLTYSETRDAYFYGEYFTVKSRDSARNNFDDSPRFYYFGDSEISICSGAIYSYLSYKLVNDNCDNGKMGFNTSIMHSFSGSNLHGSGGGYYMSGCAWDSDGYGESDKAVMAAPVEEVFKI